MVVICGPRVAALLGTLGLVKPAVALFSILNNLVPTEGSVALLEAVVLLVVGHRVQHSADVLHGAGAELVVVVSVAAGGAGEHDVVTPASTWPTFCRIVVRGAEVVTNLVSQSQLGDLGGDPGVVVDESYYAGVETPLSGVMNPVNILCVSFVFLTDSPTGSRGRGYPGEAQSSPCEVSVGENVGQTEVGVILLTVQVEKVGNVYVTHTKWVLWRGLTVGVVQYFDSVDLEGVSSVASVPSVELRVPVDSVDGLDMLGYNGEDLLLGLGVGLLLFPDMFPQQWICLDKQRTRLSGGGWIERSFLPIIGLL